MNNLIIPMAGKGERFLRANYKTYKPFLISKNSNTILENIFNKFDKNINKIFIVSNKLNKKYISILKKIHKSKIIKISPHKLGPGYSIIRAEKKISKLKNIFVSYSDIEWIWNNRIGSLSKNTIFCFKGYHPFTVDNNNYAFCKINKNQKFIRLKEKSSFTNKWIKEPLSIGLFFFKDSKNLIFSLKKLIQNNVKTNNEYFPSEGFNFIKKNTSIKYVKNFIHLGKPEYFEIYKNWLNFFKLEKKFKKKIRKVNLADEIIIPAAGESKRFKKDGIKLSKYLFNIKSVKKIMVNYLSDFLPNQIKILILKNKDSFNKNSKGFKKINLQKKSNGQAHTIFMGLDSIKNNDSIFINSCDVFSIFNIKKYLKLKKTSDIIVFLSSKSFINLSPNEYTWALTNNNKLEKLYIKKKPQINSKLITGNFYFKSKNIFNKCYKHTSFSKNEMYVDEMINTAIKLKLNVKYINDDHYVNLGTPKLIKEFSYWYNYFLKDE